MDRRDSGTLTRFLNKIFARAEKPPQQPSTPVAKEQPGDLGHALTALRKGWITGGQLQSALKNSPTGDELLKRLHADGALDDRKLAALFDSALLIAPKDEVRALIDDEIARQAFSSLAVGDLLGGRYRILDIKRGGFGVVYICEARTDEIYQRGNHLVALKTLLRQHMATPEAVEMFYTEASNWISLGAHPNIVLTYGVEQHQRMHFILMEYIEGAKTLADEIIDGATDWRRALRVGVDVARALDYTQKHANLVHGDLKPQNLLVTSSGAVKVADFGLSVCQQALNGGESGALIGTEGFIAPEMYLGKTARTTATDIYAFGVILFHTATLSPPFPLRQEPPANLVCAPPDARQFEPGVPAAFAALILSCMQPAPESRPKNFEAIARQLEKMHRDLLGSEPPSAPAPDAPLQADAYVNLAQSWLELGRFKDAAHYANLAIRANAANWKAHHALGNVHREAGEYESAFRAFAKARQLAPEEILPVVGAAYSSHLGGNPDRAAEWTGLALELCTASRRYAGLEGISLMFVELFDHGTALALLDRILAEVPDSATTWNNRAILLRRMKHFEEGLASADRALKLNPAYAKAWANRANLLAEMEQFEEALESASRSLALDPTVAGAYAAKATALAQTGRLAEARQCITRGLSEIPGNPLLLRAKEVFFR